MYLKYKSFTNRKTVHLVILVCLVQFLVIAYLSYTLYFKKTSNMSFLAIDHNDVVINPDNNLRNFFEPKPDSKLEFRSDLFEGKFGTATINHDSLNERFNYSVAKDKGVFRIIALGNSSTFGWYVNTGENYPEQLEDKLNTLSCSGIQKFEVINLGVGGYDIEYAVHRFQVRGKKYNPDLVLWLVRSNDFETISDYIYNFRNQYKQELTDDVIDQYRSQGITNNPIHYEAIRELQSKIDKQRIFRYQTTKLYSINNVYDKKLILFTPTYTNSEHQKALAEFAGRREETYFDNKFIQLKQPDEAFPDFHPTALGYTKIADYVVQYLISNNIIPCH